MAERSPHGVEYARIYLPGAVEISMTFALPMDWSWREGENQNVPDVGCAAIVSGGVAGMSPSDVTEQLADLGASVSFSPRADEVDATVTVRRENTDAALKIVTAMLTDPSYDPLWVSRESSRIASYFIGVRDDPDYLAYATVNTTVLRSGPLLRAYLGESIPRIFSISQNDLKRWHASVFRGPAQFVSIAGDVDEASAGKLVDALLGVLPDGGKRPETTLDLEIKPKQILLHLPSAKKSVLSFVGIRPPVTGKAEDSLIRDAMNDSDGTLFSALRDHLAAAYAVSLEFREFGAQHRIMVISGEVDTSKLAAAVAAFGDVYGTFVREGLSSKLDRRKYWLMRSYDEQLSGTDESVSQMDLVRSYGGSYSETFSDLIGSVTAADIARRLADYPRASDFLVIAVSPDANALPGACVITAPEQAVNCK